MPSRPGTAWNYSERGRALYKINVNSAADVPHNGRRCQRYLKLRGLNSEQREERDEVLVFHDGLFQPRGAAFFIVRVPNGQLRFGQVFTVRVSVDQRLHGQSANRIFPTLEVVAISRFTGDPESRFIAITLCPLATAAFVSWGTRWQLAMALTAVAGYGVGEYLIPIETPFGTYRWMGLFAAVIFAQYTTIFIDRYRRRLHAQVYALEEAARFRQSQIATMAHDIRSPVAALSGYVNLLEDDELNPKERADLMGRIGSTAWNMNLVVSNVLDYYDIQENEVVATPTELDPNIVIAEVSEDCALQARRRRLALRTEFSRLPMCRLDPRHLDRIVRNLLAYAIGRMSRGEVVVRTGVHNEMIVVDISDNGSMVPMSELDGLFQGPDKDGRSGPGSGLGLYVARAMADVTQFLFISHNKITMEIANQLIGVTMQEAGVSRVVTVDIEQAIKLAEEAA